MPRTWLGGNVLFFSCSQGQAQESLKVVLLKQDAGPSVDDHLYCFGPNLVGLGQCKRQRSRALPGPGPPKQTLRISVWAQHHLADPRIRIRFSGVTTLMKNWRWDNEEAQPVPL